MFAHGHRGHVELPPGVLGLGTLDVYDRLAVDIAKRVKGGPGAFRRVGHRQADVGARDVVHGQRSREQDNWDGSPHQGRPPPVSGFKAL